MSSKLTDASVVTRGDGWLSAWVGDEHVMMSAETGICISLSETGGRIWELLEQPRSLDSLCAQLADEYEIEHSALRHDVVAFLESMESQKAVQVQ